MQLIINAHGKKKTVIFIHGFRKNFTDWNITKTGKPIRIEEQLRSTNNTVLVQIEEEDYKRTIAEIAETIYTGISELLNTKITIVAHSYGCFYALLLAETYAIGRLLLIEPVIKSSTYLAELELKALNKDPESVELAKVRNFQTLPTVNRLKSSVIVRIHLNVIDNIPNLAELDRLTNKNTKSRLMVHYNASHMIHYKLPHLIIDSIKELIV